MSNVTVLVVDCRYSTDTRPDRLRELCDLVWPGCAAECVGAVPTLPPCPLPDLVLLHAGPDQGRVGLSLRDGWLNRIPCLLYCGNSLSDDATAYVLGNNCFVGHVPLPEPIPMTGDEPGEGKVDAVFTPSAEERKLKECLKRILVDKESSRKAVEDVYGDPVLEGNLNQLYDALRDKMPIAELVKLRNDLLGKEPWE